MDLTTQKTSGSAAPIPGRCGRKLKRTDPPRYCMKWPMQGRDACERCGGKSLVGAQHAKFKGGSTSKYSNVTPKALQGLLDPRRIRDAASCADELMLVDARTAEVLRDIDAANPTGTIRETGLVLDTLRCAVEAEDKDAQLRLMSMLEDLLGQTAAVQSGWNEIHRLFDTRAKLSRAELGWQEFLSKKIVIQQLDVFIRALVSQARALTDDRVKLSTYVVNVIRLSEGVIGQALVKEAEDIVDVEAIENRALPESGSGQDESGGLA